MKTSLKEIKSENFVWINILRPTKPEAAELKRRWHFTDEDLIDIQPPLQHPKLTDNENYLFLILLYPVYDRSTKRIHPVEVDFFIGQDFLVSTMSEEFFPLENFFSRAVKNQKEMVKFLTRSPAYLLTALFAAMEKYCYPMLVHVSNDIIAVEKEIFAVNKKETIHEMLLIKTNIANFREAADRHPRIISKLSDKLGRFALTSDFEPQLKEAADRSKDTRALLEDFTRTINALHETHTSLLNFRTNTVMQTFTVFTSLIFSSSLIIDLLKLKEASFGATILVIMLVSLVMLLYFRRRRWL